MKTFDLEQAKKDGFAYGKDGKKYNILTFNGLGNHPIIAQNQENFSIKTFTTDGCFWGHKNTSNEDLYTIPSIDNILNLTIDEAGDLIYRIGEIEIGYTSQVSGITHLLKSEVGKKAYKEWIKSERKFCQERIEWKGVTYWINGSKMLTNGQESLFSFFELIPFENHPTENKNFAIWEHTGRIMMG